MKSKSTFVIGLTVGFLLGVVISVATLFTAAVFLNKQLEEKPKLPTVTVDAVTTHDDLLTLTQDCPAEVGYYGINLTTGKTVSYRPGQPACLASIVKLFTLLETMRRVEDGILNPSETISLEYDDRTIECTIDDALNLMIGQSDNSATDALTALVGYDQVNNLPEELKISGLADKVLPEPGILPDTLDIRVKAKTHLAPVDTIYPQHGTAEGIVQYFQLLDQGKLLSPTISKRVLEVLDRNPKNFAPGATEGFTSVGKGGSLLWTRPFYDQYNMLGWGLYIRNENTRLALCIWTEYFPDNLNEESKWNWTRALSESIVHVLLTE